MINLFGPAAPKEPLTFSEKVRPSLECCPGISSSFLLVY
jgi:hypothetical protein